MLKRTLLLALLLLLSCRNQDYSQIRVTKIIDGDTIELSGGRRLRYIGIDTPEVRRKAGNSFIYDPQPFSLEAKDYNRKLVKGKNVRIEFDIEKADRYGRLLGYCYVGDIFVNAELVKEGYAKLYTFPPNVKHIDLLRQMQKEAHKQRKGLWSLY